MLNNNHRKAQPGDHFVLLIPTAQELHHLRQWQSELQAQYGGQSVDFLHVTCQRFTPKKNQSEGACIKNIKLFLEKTRIFSLYTDKVIHFYAPYWDKMVLRWRVQDTGEFIKFRTNLTAFLSKNSCDSHFERIRSASCTILNLNEEINSNLLSPELFPSVPLFTVRSLLISKLNTERSFETLETINLYER
jgi:hypothetical protein